MNKKIIPLSLAVLLGIVALGACQKPTASSTPEASSSATTSSSAVASSSATPSSSSSAETVYSLAISNKDALTAEWHVSDPNRTVELNIAPAVNILSLLNKGDLTLTSSDPTVVYVAGQNLTVLKAGTAKITVSLFGKYTDTVDITTLAEVFNSISEITKAGKYNVRGVVSGLNTKGFILNDGTASVYVYLNGKPSVKIGDKLKVTQTLTEADNKYNGFYQFTSSAKLTPITDDYTAAEAVPLTPEIAATFATVDADPTALKKYSWTTTVVAAGDYTALPLEGSTVTIENTYTLADLAVKVGCKYNVEGYFYGYASKYKYAAFSLTKVTQEFDPITSIAVEADQNVCAVGGTDQMSATILPTTAHQEFTWSVANKDTTVTDTLATIDKTGLLTGVKAGVVVVSATSNDDTTKIATTEVTIFEATDPVTGISLDQTTLSIYATLTKTLKATITAGGTAFLDAETWTSSDTKIATVDKKGVVTAVKAGTAKITATTVAKDASGKQLTATCDVTVVDATIGSETAPLSVSALLESAPVFCAQTNGTFAKDMVYVTGKVTSVSYGATYTAGKYTITIADPADSTKTIKATGVDYTGDAQAIFVNDTVVLHHYLEYYKSYSLYFNKDASGNKLYGTVLSRTAGTSKITVEGADNATITGLEATYVNDATATFDVVAKTGYVLDSVTVGTTALTADATTGKYSFVVAGDMTVTVATHVAGQAATLTKTITTAASTFTAASDNLSATLTDAPVTLKIEKNTSSSALRLSDTDHIRIYSGAKFTVTLGSGTLQSIKFTCQTAAYATTLGGLTFTGGTVGTVAATDVDVTVTAAAGSNVVTFTVDSTQIRLSSIVVAYIAA